MASSPTAISEAAASSKKKKKSSNDLRYLKDPVREGLQATARERLINTAAETPLPTSVERPSVESSGAEPDVPWMSEKGRRFFTGRRNRRIAETK